MQRQFINVEEALNFIEKHEALGDLDLYEVNEEGVAVKKGGAKRLLADFLHAIRLSSTKKVQLGIVRAAISHLREDFSPLKNKKIADAITQLEELVKQAPELDLVSSALRRFRVALRDDADFRLKRQQLMVEAATQKIEKLKEINKKWIPGHILDFLCEIEDQFAMYEDEVAVLAKGHKVYTSIIEKSRRIDEEMELVRKKHLERLPNALNWGVLLSLEEMTENGIPQLKDIQPNAAFLINDIYVTEVKKKYAQLRRLYLKHHSQLRKDLKGAFDNNFAEFEGRLYFAEQMLKRAVDATDQ